MLSKLLKTEKERSHAKNIPRQPHGTPFKGRPYDPEGRSMDGWTYYVEVTTFHRSTSENVQARGFGGGSAIGPLRLCEALRGWGACRLSLCLASPTPSRESPAMGRHTAIWTTSMTSQQAPSRQMNRRRNKEADKGFVITRTIWDFAATKKEGLLLLIEY